MKPFKDHTRLHLLIIPKSDDVEKVQHMYFYSHVFMQKQFLNSVKQTYLTKEVTPFVVLIVNAHFCERKIQGTFSCFITSLLDT